MTLDERLDKIEALLLSLVERQTVKDFYEVEEFAHLVGKTCLRLEAEKACVRGRARLPAWK